MLISTASASSWKNLHSTLSLHLKKNIYFIFDCTESSLWCTGLVALWHVVLPRTGIKPISPALVGEFPTSGPPEKSLKFALGEISPPEAPRNHTLLTCAGTLFLNWCGFSPVSAKAGCCLHVFPIKGGDLGKRDGGASIKMCTGGGCHLVLSIS